MCAYLCLLMCMCVHTCECEQKYMEEGQKSTLGAVPQVSSTQGFGFSFHLLRCVRECGMCMFACANVCMWVGTCNVCMPDAVKHPGLCFYYFEALSLSQIQSSSTATSFAIHFGLGKCYLCLQKLKQQSRPMCLLVLVWVLEITDPLASKTKDLTSDPSSWHLTLYLFARGSLIGLELTD